MVYACSYHDTGGLLIHLIQVPVGLREKILFFVLLIYVLFPEQECAASYLI